MTKTVKVILSTFGGRLTEETKVDVVKEALRSADLDFKLLLTERAEHAVELAQQASGEGSTVVAAGGDGTINEVVNGLMQSAGEDEAGPLGIIPMGTANDLVHGLGIPLDLKAACQRIAVGNTRLIDVARVNDRYFVNNSAIGLEAVVTATHAEMRWLNGNARYMVAALKTIAKAKSWEMKISWSTGQYEGPVTLVSVGNNRRTGGAFIMAPHAVLDDGLLDFTYSMDLNRLQMVQLLPKTFSGDHIHHPMVNYKQTPFLSIVSSSPTPLQADGEIIGTEVTELNYHIIPRKLHVIV